MSVAASIARFLIDPPAFNPEMRTQAAAAITDTIGTALAGWDQPAPQKVRGVKAMERLPASRSNEGDLAHGWGDGIAAAPETTALINGTASHALDYDDVILEVTAHPSGSLTAAALASAEALQQPGRKVITAYLLGLEILIRVGQALGFRHYQLGWHATGTLGVLGSTAAAGHLFALDEQQLTHALGIAASLSGGLRRNFGTMTKPLHMGLAAEHGVLAARLASQGFTADADIFAPGGFVQTFSGGQETGWEPDRLTLGKPYYLEEAGISVKQYPCCYATHRLIDGALKLRNQGVDASAVDSIEVTAPPGTLTPLNQPRPHTGLEGKFSGEYTIAAALLDGKVTLASFTDEAVGRPQAQALLRRVSLHEETGPTPENATLEDGVIHLSCQLETGRRLTVSVETIPGSPSRPLSDDALKAKFSDCLQTWGLDDSDQIASRYHRWSHLDEEASVSALVQQTAAALAGGGSA